jgi:hypothetical protein
MRRFNFSSAESDCQVSRLVSFSKAIIFRLFSKYRQFGWPELFFNTNQA